MSKSNTTDCLLSFNYYKSIFTLWTNTFIACCGGDLRQVLAQTPPLWTSASVSADRTRSRSRSTVWSAQEGVEHRKSPWQACSYHPWKWSSSFLYSVYNHIWNNSCFLVNPTHDRYLSRSRVEIKWIPFVLKEVPSRSV